MDRDHKILILKILDSPYIDPPFEARFLSLTAVAISGVACESAEGILSAHVIDGLSVSFDNEDKWVTSNIPLSIRDDLSGESTTVDVRHACRTTHIKNHLRWASRRTCPPTNLVPTSEKPLPNVSVSSLIVDDDWQRFYESTSALGALEKTARLREVAAEIAFVNGYDLSVRLSSLNSQRFNALRQIFVSAFTDVGHEFYLSTDFEKAAGAFEFYDHRGNHLGEWLFAGGRNGDPDTTGHHNILLAG